MGASFGPSWGCVTRARESEPKPPELPRIFKCWALLFVNRLKTVVETLFGWQVDSSCLCSPPAWLLLGGFFGGMVCGLVLGFFHEHCWGGSDSAFYILLVFVNVLFFKLKNIFFFSCAFFLPIFYFSSSLGMLSLYINFHFFGGAARWLLWVPSLRDGEIKVLLNIKISVQAPKVHEFKSHGITAVTEVYDTQNQVCTYLWWENVTVFVISEYRQITAFYKIVRV